MFSDVLATNVTKKPALIIKCLIIIIIIINITIDFGSVFFYFCPFYDNF